MKLINQIFNGNVINDDFRDSKGKDRYVDFEQSEAELEVLLGSVYENERKYQPRKQKIHMRWFKQKKPIISWMDERGGDCGRSRRRAINSKTEGMIRNNIGKPYNDVFSEFTHKCKTDKLFKTACFCKCTLKGKNPTKLLQRDFEEYFTSRYGTPEYVVDNEGLIQYQPRKRHPQSRDIILYKGPEPYFAIDIKALEYMRPVFMESRVADLYSFLYLNGRADGSTAYRIRTELESMLRSAVSYDRGVKGYYNMRCKDAWSKVPFVWAKCVSPGSYSTIWPAFEYIFHNVDERERTVLKVHTPEWKREMHKRKAKKYKVDHSKYDRSLKVQRFMKRHGFICECVDASFHTLMEHSLEEHIGMLEQNKYKQALKMRWGYSDASKYTIRKRLESAQATINTLKELIKWKS
jgi:hypothetical protein